MKYIIICLSILCTLQLAAQDYDKELLQSKVDVVFLASDMLGGRETGTPGEEMAAQYIANRFADMGLTGKGTAGFFQPFDFKFKPNPHSNDSEKRRGKNVVAYLDNGAKTTVVIGGHYDHLGLGHFGSRDVGEPEIHNGADDNASGIAVMFWLAERLKNSSAKDNNYLFIAFSGEELGLYGSKYYVNNPTVDLKTVNYMLNLDMVGRLNEAKVLAINGAGTSPAWKANFEKIDANGIQVKTTDSGIGPSDHTSFYLQDIPALHFFSGQHTDYHKPEDDAILVNYEGMLDIASFMLQLIENLNGTRLEFSETKDDNAGRQAAAFKVTLGIMPDYVHDGTGMRVDAVIPDRVGDKGGLKKGDIIIKMGDRDVKDIYDYMEGLADFKKGDKTTVLVMRDKKEVKLKVTF